MEPFCRLGHGGKVLTVRCSPQTCNENEMLDFPRRMRDWLFNIMRDMAERSELTPHYLSMEREAETNLTRRWTNAAIWKWCDLDAHDNDRSARNTALGLTSS